MGKYSNAFKLEAIRLSDEIGLKKAAAQLGLPPVISEIILDIFKDLKHYDNDYYIDKIKIEIVIGKARYEIR